MVWSLWTLLLFVLPHMKEPSEFCHFDGLNSKHPLILVSPSAYYAATWLVQREDVLVKFLEKKKMKNEKKECKFLIDYKYDMSLDGTHCM